MRRKDYGTSSYRSLRPRRASIEVDCLGPPPWRRGRSLEDPSCAGSLRLLSLSAIGDGEGRRSSGRLSGSSSDSEEFGVCDGGGGGGDWWEGSSVKRSKVKFLLNLNKDA